MSVRARDNLRIALVYILCIVFILFFCVPVVWAILSSVKSSSEIFTWPPTFIPETWTWEHYIGAAEARNIIGVFGNSLIIAFFTVIISVALGFFAAYPMARHNTRGYRILLSMIMVGRMIPAVALAVPIHRLFSQIHLLNTKSGLIICYTMFCLPFSIFLLKSFIQQIPADIEEAALIDGCSKMQIIMKVILPLSTVGLGVAAIFDFLLSWNDLFFAVVLTSSDSARTVPVAIVMFQTDRNTNFGQLYAFLAMGMLPAIMFALFAQKYMVQGLTMGAVKG